MRSANMRQTPVKNRAQVVLFKRDLRTVDHHPLQCAIKAGPVLPLLVIEHEWWLQPDSSARQYDFYRECVLELSAELARLGQPLIVRMGSVIDVLNELMKPLVSHRFGRIRKLEMIGPFSATSKLQSGADQMALCGLSCHRMG